MSRASLVWLVMGLARLQEEEKAMKTPAAKGDRLFLPRPTEVVTVEVLAVEAEFEHPRYWVRQVDGEEPGDVFYASHDSVYNDRLAASIVSAEMMREIDESGG